MVVILCSSLIPYSWVCVGSKWSPVLELMRCSGTSTLGQRVTVTASALMVAPRLLGPIRSERRARRVDKRTLPFLLLSSL